MPRSKTSTILVLSLLLPVFSVTANQASPERDRTVFPLASIPESREISNAGKTTPADLSPYADREADLDTASSGKPASVTNAAKSIIIPTIYFQAGGSSVPDSFDSSINFFVGARLFMLSPDGGGCYLDLSAGVRGSPAGQDRMETDIGFGFCIGTKSILLTFGGYISLCEALEDYGTYVEDWDNPGHYTYQRQGKFLKAAAGIDIGFAINMIPANSPLAYDGYFALMFDVRFNLGPYPGDIGQSDYKDVSWSIGFGFGL